LLIKEVHDYNEKGKEFDVAQSINSQLPFFTCRNHLIDEDIQNDIQRYIYCKEMGVPPYSGSFGDQPYKWVQRFFSIKSAFAKLESSQIEKVKKKAKNG
tara:strand:- start:7665 stop:7961 length:297 start_codon:yes stop_codon:yes gene_type:complete